MNKRYKLPDNLDKFLENLSIKDVGVNEISKKEVGMSFEPRTLTRYEIKSSDKIMGYYEYTEFYQKDGKTLVTGFGKFVEN